MLAPMADTNPRADLGALRIQREDDEPRGGAAALGKIIICIVVLAIVGALGYAVYQQWIVPSRAPMVVTIVLKPTVNVANPPLLTASGYLVASRTATLTPKISGKVVKLNVDTGMNVKKGDVIAVLESTNVQAQLDEANASLSEAQREYDRQVALWNQGGTSRALYDSAA